jgi:membrane protein implicated in regulation of membrane protease activity
MAIIETWWAWVAFGIIFMLLELMMPSYLFLGFGLGAIVTGITLALGITMSAQYLMLLFAIASLISWILLRQFFKLPKGNVKTFDHDINDN